MQRLARAVSASIDPNAALRPRPRHRSAAGCAPCVRETGPMFLGVTHVLGVSFQPRRSPMFSTSVTYVSRGFFSAIVLFNNQPLSDFPRVFGGFLERRIPGKNGEATPRILPLRTSPKGKPLQGPPKVMPEPQGKYRELALSPVRENELCGSNFTIFTLQLSSSNNRGRGQGAAQNESCFPNNPSAKPPSSCHDCWRGTNLGRAECKPAFMSALPSTFFPCH